MEINMDPLQRQMLDDVFDAFTMLTNGSMCSLMHVDGGFTRYTPSAVELLGLPGEYIPNGAMDWNDYLHPDDRKRYMDVMMPLLEGKTQTYDITYRVRTVKGDYLFMRAVGAVLRGSDGKPSLIGGALFNEGLTDRVDPVTILPTKKVYLEDLARAVREGKEAFSLQVGISQFPEINKIHGYTYGNRIIQEISLILQEAVEKRGKIYRMDGATFVIFTEKLNKESMAALYDYIRYRLRLGVEVNGLNHGLLANGGLISTFSSATDAQTIFSCLQLAYDESENLMHGALVDFNESVRYANTKSLEMLSIIRENINNECTEFHLEYLPIFDAKTEKLVGAETVIYWENKKYGRVQSKDFLPILEHDFIFEDLSDFIIQKSFSDAKKFLEKNPNFYLCLNVHRLQLESDYFVESILFYLSESKFPADSLYLKLDSNCRYVDADKIKKIISQLHEQKISIVIDDFGNGANSLEILNSESIDAVSIVPNLKKNTLRHLVEIAKDYVKNVNICKVNDKNLKSFIETLPVSTFQNDDPLDLESMIKIF